MPWLKLLHISTLILWCGALLYLPGAIAASTTRATDPLPRPHGHMARGMFTTVATPAALLAIASGTAIFVFYGPFAVWLVAKLAVVSLLVLCHAACGMLIMKVERDRHASVRGRCAALGALSVLLVLGIAWLVLRKPF